MFSRDRLFIGWDSAATLSMYLQLIKTLMKEDLQNCVSKWQRKGLKWSLCICQLSVTNV